MPLSPFGTLQRARSHTIPGSIAPINAIPANNIPVNAITVNDVLISAAPTTISAAARTGLPIDVSTGLSTLKPRTAEKQRGPWRNSLPSSSEIVITPTIFSPTSPVGWSDWPTGRVGVWPIAQETGPKSMSQLLYPEGIGQATKPGFFAIWIGPRDAPNIAGFVTGWDQKFSITQVISVSVQDKQLASTCPGSSQEGDELSMRRPFYQTLWSTSNEQSSSSRI